MDAYQLAQIKVLKKAIVLLEKIKPDPTKQYSDFISTTEFLEELSESEKAHFDDIINRTGVFKRYYKPAKIYSNSEVPPEDMIAIDDVLFTENNVSILNSIRVIEDHIKMIELGHKL